MNDNTIKKNNTSNKNNKSKTHDTNNKRKIGPIDLFYDTMYTANTVNKITKIHDDIRYRCICHNCKCSTVDTQIVVQDTYHPTFVVQRKNYCSQCWIMKVSTNSTKV